MGTVQKYKYFIYYNIYTKAPGDKSIVVGDGSAEYGIDTPIVSFDNLKEIAQQLGHGGEQSCMIVNYRLMARMIDGVWVSADA